MGKKIGMVGYGRPNIAKILSEIDNIIIMGKQEVKIIPKRYPLTEKQVLIIKSMQNGSFIETTNRCSWCNGLHITSQSLQELYRYGFLKTKEYVGRYSKTHCLTNFGADYSFNPLI